MRIVYYFLSTKMASNSLSEYMRSKTIFGWLIRWYAYKIITPKNYIRFCSELMALIKKHVGMKYNGYTLYLRTKKQKFSIGT